MFLTHNAFICSSYCPFKKIVPKQDAVNIPSEYMMSCSSIIPQEQSQK